MIYDDVFKYKAPVFGKLLDFGFIFQDNKYEYDQKIVDNQFELKICIFNDGKIQIQVIDSDTGDEYRLHLIDGVVGEFVGKVRTECLKILQAIADNCFEAKIYKTEYANKIINYVKEKYCDNLEYLWKNFPEYAVLRRADNKKWYAILMVVERDKIGLSGNEKIEIIDLRGNPEELKNLIDGKKYFEGYHMNKKSWFTICLDGSLDLKEIYTRIDNSYQLAKKTDLKK